MAFEIGQVIDIPCEIGEGAFPDELLVAVDTKTGPVSGFVRAESVHGLETKSPYLRGTVVDVEDDTVVVRLHGSFFTTTGITYFNKNRLRA